MTARRRIPPGLRVVIVPRLDHPQLTITETMALSVRNAATVSGRCACGAAIQGLPDEFVPGEFIDIRMVHEDDCPAISTAALRGARKLRTAR